MRILLAEDDPILGDGLARALRRSGYAVDWVESGPAADAALAAHRYDLLILDLGLPPRPKRGCWNSPGRTTPSAPSSPSRWKCSAML